MCRGINGGMDGWTSILGYYNCQRHNQVQPIVDQTIKKLKIPGIRNKKIRWLTFLRLQIFTVRINIGQLYHRRKEEALFAGCRGYTQRAQIGMQISYHMTPSCCISHLFLKTVDYVVQNIEIMACVYLYLGPKFSSRYQIIRGS